MFDGTTLLDVAVEADSNGQLALLTNGRLTFAGLVDTQTGFVISPIRKAFDRGLTFRLVPRNTGKGYRVEVKGSLHKFHNNGQHNADQFTADDLLLTLDQLVHDYGFDLFNSKVNNIEFGVNLLLPFPVSRVLTNLLCYKNQSFTLDTRSDTPYYVCQRQHYAVKIYDKGKQKELDYPLLRFEVRVRKMEYFNGTGVRLRTLADLMNVSNYGPLGALLVGTFSEILFDDPAVKPADLTPRERKIYQDGRNPRHWQTPGTLTSQQATAHRQQLSRDKKRYRALLNQYGDNWQQEVTALIGQTWNQLTAVDDRLLTKINQYRAVWKEPAFTRIRSVTPGADCHKLTGYDSPVNADTSAVNCHKLTDLSTPDLSQINPLYSGVDCDIIKPGRSTPEPDPKPQTPGAVSRDPVVCPVTGVAIERPRPGQRFVSATILRTNDDLLLTLDTQHRQYAKGSKEDDYSRAAHNVRNKDSNPRNNLRRLVNQCLEEREHSLFPDHPIPLTNAQRALLDHWRGTPYEVRL
jgi:hypothetical protein